MVATAPTAVEATTAVEETYLYELVPLLPLPEVDLSVSVKSHFIRSPRIHRLLRHVSHSPLTFVGYIASLGFAIAVFYVPAWLGRMLSVVVLLIGVPGALVSIANLRFDMVAVMSKTYDMWFFGSVSTIVSVVLGLLLQDARALLMVTSWFSFVTNICADASTLGLRHIWFANVGSVISYIAMAGAISVDATDGLKAFDLVRINGHVLPAVGVVRDSVITMIIVIARNVIRKHAHALSENKTAAVATDFRCVSFRCRLQLCIAAHNAHQTGGEQITPQHSETLSVRSPSVTSRTKLRFKPDLASIDVRNTLVPMRWLWRLRNKEIRRLQTSVPWIGVLGFGVTNIIYLVNVTWPHRWRQQVQLPIILLATSASTVFVAVTVAAMQRQLLRAVVTSFDFLFIVVDITIVHVALADILGWHLITVLALFSELQWCVWILCWDAITPPVRRRLGLSRRFAAYIGPSLVAVLGVVVIIIFMVKPPDAIHDRIIYHFQFFDHPVEFRALTWYFSCAATISSWAIRIMWRLWLASETELVVLDGTVVYKNHVPSRSAGPKPTLHQVAHAPGHGATGSSPPAEVNVIPCG